MRRNWFILLLFFVVLAGFASRVTAVSPASINSVAPNAVPAGSGSAPVTIVGQNFVPGSTVLWTAPNGPTTAIDPSLIQAAQVAATIPSAFLTSPGTAQLAVRDPSGILTNQVPFTITSPVWIDSVTPDSAPSGSATTAISIRGPRFTTGSTVLWRSPGGQVTPIAPDLIQSAQIAATVSAALLSSPGTAYVGVSDAQGVLSNQAPFQIPLTLSSVTPPATPYGSGNTPITIAGPKFTAGSKVVWSGPNANTTITPDLIQAAQIAATLPSAFLSSPGTAQLAILDPSGVLSSRLPFTISSSISLSALAPAALPVQSGTSTLTILGSGFSQGSKLHWTDVNGNVTQIVPDLVQAAQIVATIQSVFLTTAGTAQLAIVDSGGAVSNRLPLTISPFTINSATPNSAPVGSTATPVSIGGGTFTPGSTVSFTPPGGAPVQITADLIQAAQVAATIPAALLTSPGTAQLAIANAAGVPSNSLPFTISSFTISSVSPSTTPAGSSATSITVAGQTFTGGSSLLFTTPGGQTVPITPDLIQSAQIAATVPAALLTSAGTAQVAIASAGGVVSNALPFSISAVPISIQTSVIPAAFPGEPYSVPLKANGTNVLPLTWTVATGSLPSGITLDSATGVLAGTAATPGVYAISVQVSDSGHPAQTALASYSLIVARQYVISTLAGGVPAPAAATALSAAFSSPTDFVMDKHDNLYVVTRNTVYKIDVNGVFTRVAGIGRGGYSGDGGLAVNAQLFSPSGVALDASGNVYIADTDNGRIRKVSTSGIITTVAGNGTSADYGDGGGAVNAGLSGPRSLAIDATGNIYVATASRIRKISPSNTISTVVGGNAFIDSGDGGPAANAEIAGTNHLALDDAGNLYVSTYGNRIRKVSAVDSVITTVAGTGVAGFSGDGGPAVNAQLNFPSALVTDHSGAIYFTDTINLRIRRIAADGTISTLEQGFLVTSLARDSAGNLYISNGQILKIGADGSVVAFAGAGNFSGDGGPASLAEFSFQSGVAIDSAGNIFVGDTNNRRIRKIAPNGAVSTIAGNGSFADPVYDIPATSTALTFVQGIAADPRGALFFADGTCRISKIDTNGILRTAAGSGTCGDSGDGGQAANATLNYPQAVQVDSSGNVYIADLGNHKVRRIDTAGVITTVAGNGTPGLSGDGGAAINAQLDPYTLAIDNAGNLYIADTGNRRIRRVSPDGVISTFAGGGGASPGDGGLATDAYLFGPSGVATDRLGNVYIADYSTIRKVTQDGRIETIAGAAGAADYSGDGGPAIEAHFPSNGSLSVDAAGAVYLTDNLNAAIRVLHPSAALPFSITTDSFLPNGELGQTYSATTITATGGTPNYLWSGTGLPPGLFLDPATGIVAGTPSAQGKFEFSITATDSGTQLQTGTSPQTTSRNFVIPVYGLPQIITTSLPTGFANLSYPVTPIVVAGGTPPYNWQVSSGTLPAGLNLNATTGEIKGAPLAQGPSTFTAQVTDSSVPAQTATQILSLAVVNRLTLTPSPLPRGNPGAPYSTGLVSVGNSPYVCTLTDGTLPAGLNLDSATCTIAGVPTTLGTRTFTVSISDSSNPAQTALPTWSLSIGDPALSITTTVLPAVWLNTAASGTAIAASGGRGALTWSISSGSLPSGLTLDPATGSLTGVPTSAGVYPFSVRVSDAGTPSPQTVVRSFSLLVAQQYVISTFAGGVPPPTPSTARSASLQSTTAVTYDRAGNAYFTSGNSVFKVDQAGVLTSIAGTGIAGYSGDGGPATKAQLNDPQQMAFDAAGNLYVADRQNIRIRRISPAGVITTVLGNGSSDGSPISDPVGVVVDAAGNFYVADQAAYRVRKITPSGDAATIYSGTTVVNGDTLREAPFALALDRSGNVYFSTGDFANGGRILKYAPDATTTTAAVIGGATSISLDSSGNIYAGVPRYNFVFKAATDGSLSQVPGSQTFGSSMNVASDSAGNLLIATGYYGEVVSIPSGGSPSILAGFGDPALNGRTAGHSFAGDGGLASAAQLGSLTGVAADRNGNVFLSDYLDASVRKVTANGEINAVAGGPLLGNGYSGDGGPAANAQFANPGSMAVDPSGNLYVTDNSNRVIRKIDSANTVTSLSTLAPFAAGLAVDPTGNLYIAEWGSNQVWRIDPAGNFSIAAGNGVLGFSGDGGPATSAQLSSPQGVAVDPSGSLYIADTYDQFVRKVTPDGIISTFAGALTQPYSGDGGPATSASMTPTALAADNTGVYILDASHNTVRRVSPSGIITTIAGNGAKYHFVDGGAAVDAFFEGPADIAADGLGKIYVAESPFLASQSSIRLLTPSSAPPLTLSTRLLPNSDAGKPYPATALAATGGTPGYTFSASGLPAGLSLDPATGTITGTPSPTEGAFWFTVTVTDSGTVALTGTPAQTASQNYSITVANALRITNKSLPDSQPNVIYPAATVSVAGGAAPYTWSITSGTLPTGLTLDPSTGAIAGTPTAPSVFNFTVKVTDSGTPTATATQFYTVNISIPNTGGGGNPPPGGGSSSSSIAATPTSLTLNVPAKGGLATDTVAVTYQSSTDATASFTAAVKDSSTPWLTVSPSSGSMTPAGTGSFQTSLIVTASPKGLSGGTYTGAIVIAAGTQTVTVPVTFNVPVQPTQLNVVPQSLSFTWRQGDPVLPPSQNLSVFGDPRGSGFTAFSSEGAWLVVPGSGSGVLPGLFAVGANVANLAAGSYSGQITVKPAIGPAVNVPVALTVLPAAQPKLSVNPLTQTFALTKNSSPSGGQVTISNAGGGTLQFSAQASSAQGSWLSLSGATSGTAVAASPAVLGFAVDPSGLKPGIYTGQILVSDKDSSSQAAVAITLAVSDVSQSLVLSRSGMTFGAAANGPQPPQQSFTVLNQSQSTMSWTAHAQAISGNWLSVDTASGASAGGQPGQSVRVFVDQKDLAPGQYYGSVEVTAPDAVNSPQTVSVELVVTADGTAPGIVFSTGGAILSGAAGQGSVSQQVGLFNPTGTALGYTSTSSASNGANWLSVSPATGTLTAGDNSLTIQADLSQLPAGVQTGTVTVAFADGSSGTIQVIVIAAGSAGASPASALAPRSLQPAAAGAAVCSGGTPGFLIAAFRQPLQLSVLPAAVAQTVQLQVLDDCSKPVGAPNGGGVSVSFDNGNAGIALHDIGNGIWEGTWTPSGAAGSVALQAVATAPGLASGSTLAGSARETVTIRAAAADSAAQPISAVNAAAGTQAVPQFVAPGEYVAIYGTNLASGGDPAAASLPLPAALNGTQLFLGGLPLPLSYAGAGQVNGLIPQSLNANTTYQLIVQRGATRSVPLPLTLTALQPGIYTQDQSGSGQGIMTIAGTAFLAAPAQSNARPVQRGVEYLTIYCTGLGSVIGAAGQPAPGDGVAAPLSPLFQTAGKVTVNIGGLDAPVQFAGLTPTLAGLYQVNVQVPAGAPVGDAVPVVMTVTSPDGALTAKSNVVTVAVQ